VFGYKLNIKPMDNPTLDDFEGVEDITGALSALEQIEKIEAQSKENKSLDQYGEIVISSI
jgi:hypothetical protein